VCRRQEPRRAKSAKHRALQVWREACTALAGLFPSTQEMTMKKLLALAPLALLAACGGNDPVSFSEPVDITLPAVQSKSVSPAGPISTSKDISTAGSNPYGSFVTAAVQHLGGKDPSHIVVSSLTLSMVTTPTGLTFDQVFSGTVSASFVMNGSGNTYAVGTIIGPTGAGPVTLAVAFDSASMTPADYAGFLQGQFKVVVAGIATSGSSGFNNSNATSETATTDATFGFIAYE
jgi:hypothetical protein